MQAFHCREFRSNLSMADPSAPSGGHTVGRHPTERHTLGRRPIKKYPIWRHLTKLPMTIGHILIVHRTNSWTIGRPFCHAPTESSFYSSSFAKEWRLRSFPVRFNLNHSRERKACCFEQACSMICVLSPWQINFLKARLLENLRWRISKHLAMGQNELILHRNWLNSPAG